ncbi:MAG: hypothetical protein IJU76_07365 [Desulfovibrionaceae bacterium]|nr:hypothetical protein [Desulfovibrionaceae bacterium]
MPFPISIVGIVVIGVGGGTVVGVAVNHDNHSRYSEYTEYSDAAERRKREEEAREKRRRENLRLAKEEMENTLEYVRSAMADAAGSRGRAVFDDWELSADDFSYKNFQKEYSRLDDSVREKILEASAAAFGEEEELVQKELEEITNLLQRIEKARLTGK